MMSDGVISSAATLISVAQSLLFTVWGVVWSYLKFNPGDDYMIRYESSSINRQVPDNLPTQRRMSGNAPTPKARRHTPRHTHAQIRQWRKNNKVKFRHKPPIVLWTPHQRRCSAQMTQSCRDGSDGKGPAAGGLLKLISLNSLISAEHKLLIKWQRGEKKSFPLLQQVCFF